MPVLQSEEMHKVRVTYYLQEDDVYSYWKEDVLLVGGKVDSVWLLDDWGKPLREEATYSPQDKRSPLIGVPLETYLVRTLADPYYRVVYSLDISSSRGNRSIDLKEIGLR